MAADVHSDDDDARLPRESRVRHLRRGHRGGKMMGLNAETDEQHHRALREPRRAAISKAPQRRQSAARRRRGAQRDAGGLARAAGHVGGETVLEGEAGFYHAYTGNNLGEAHRRASSAIRARASTKITEGLGKDWMFLETLYRIYSTAGYNIAHIDVTAKLCKENNIRYEDIDRIEAVVNWLETQYPSPAFPSRREDVDGQAGQHRLLHGLRRSCARLPGRARSRRRPRRCRCAEAKCSSSCTASRSSRRTR